MTKNILLVDTRVQAYETIVAAVNSDTCIPITFDYYTETVEGIKTKIRAALSNTPVSSSRCIGLLQHNYNQPFYSLVTTSSSVRSRVLNVARRDPNLQTWSPLRDLVSWCKATPEVNAVYFDMMACALYSDPNWKYVIDTLGTQTGVTIRASTDNTGSSSLGGNWFLESHTGVNLKTVYFTNAIDAYRGVLYLEPGEIREYSTKGVAAGSVITWGDSYWGGDTSSLSSSLSSGVIAVYFNGYAFAALKNDGSVITWGEPDWGGNSSAVSSSLSSGVMDVYSTGVSFAALKGNGRVVTWGVSSSGGDSSSVSSSLSYGVVRIYSNGSNAYAALKNNGSVITWGDTNYGGDSSSVSSELSSGVVTVYSNQYTFAALKNNGSVVTWGPAEHGGTSSIYVYDGYDGSNDTYTSVASSISSGVVAVYSTGSAYAALKSNGSVVTWGDSMYGGNLNSVYYSLTSGVVAVYSTQYAFAALKNDGSVVTWGYSSGGGDSMSVAYYLAYEVSKVSVFSTASAFAALRTDGSVITWGSSSSGGDSSSVSSELSSGVVAIYSTSSAFAALKSDGSVVTWGGSSYGGDSSSVSSSISSGVVAVYSTSGGGFAALKNNGSLVTWGNSSNGGNSDSVSSSLSAGIVNVYYNGYAFAALKTTETTFDLSMSYYTSMDRYNILRKKENRRRLNLTSLNNNVFTLSQYNDVQAINSNIPSSTILKIIVPTYVSSSYSIVSSATIPDSSGNFVIACDEGEHVTIDGSTYVNYGSYVYNRESNDSYTKTTSVTVNNRSYNLYGGDGINSSGIVFLEPGLDVQTLVSSTFVVASSKTIFDEPFAITTKPTSASDGEITYSSNNTSVATIDASGNFITLVGGGTVTFTATQAATALYASTIKTSNALTVTKLTTTLSFLTTPPTEKNVLDAAFTVTASSASSGVISYSSSNSSLATVNATTGLVTLKSPGNVTITASQASTATYDAPTNSTYSFDITPVGTALEGQPISSGTSYATLDLSGASLIGTTASGVIFSGANLSNVDFSGAIITDAVFSNANISGAINLPNFSLIQKLQLLKNINNAGVSEIQVTELVSGSVINSLLATPDDLVAGATFVVKAPTTINENYNKVVTVNSADISGNQSVYIPLNTNETVKINNVVYSFNGTNLLDTSGNIVSYSSFAGAPFKICVGSVVAVNIKDTLNQLSFLGNGLYNMLSQLFVSNNV